jgi:hypothetical protein
VAAKKARRQAAVRRSNRMGMATFHESMHPLYTLFAGFSQQKSDD